MAGVIYRNYLEIDLNNPLQKVVELKQKSLIIITAGSPQLLPQLLCHNQLGPGLLTVPSTKELFFKTNLWIILLGRTFPFICFS